MEVPYFTSLRQWQCLFLASHFEIEFVRICGWGHKRSSERKQLGRKFERHKKWKHLNHVIRKIANLKTFVSLVHNFLHEVFIFQVYQPNLYAQQDRYITIIENYK